MRVADLIAQRLVQLGVRQAYAVTGGGAMHLNDALGEASGLACTYLHHEQACAMAAEGNIAPATVAISILRRVFIR